MLAIKFNPFHDALGRFSDSGVRLRPHTMEEDMKAQSAWLESLARAHGYRTLDDFASHDPQKFNHLAEVWRKRFGPVQKLQLAAIFKFDPSQPRDKVGRWSASGREPDSRETLVARAVAAEARARFSAKVRDYTRTRNFVLNNREQRRGRQEMDRSAQNHGHVNSTSMRETHAHDFGRLLRERARFEREHALR